MLKRLLFYFTFIGMVFGSTSCKQNEEPFELRVDDRFAVTVPGFLKEDLELAPTAVMQYANRFRNLYTVVLDTSGLADDQFNDYHKWGLGIIHGYLDNPTIIDSGKTIINGLEANYVQLFGEMQDERIYYDYASVNGADHFYQVCSWTRGEERRLRYKDTMKDFIFSFREL